jgi:branched-chain amino acid transport system ATP-binding protein
VRALDGVSMTLEGCGIIGIIGPNGSGKSTLMAILSGLLRPSAGEVYLNSRRVTGAPAHKFAELGVARTFQHFRLVPELRLWENLLVGGMGADFADKRWGLGPRRHFDALVNVASRFGLEDSLDAWPDTLPSAVLRQAEIARAVLSNPRVLLCDEPAAGLTGPELDGLLDALRDVSRTSLVVVIEHNMHVIEGLAQRVLVLMNGRLVADGVADEIAELPIVREGYLGIA